MQRREFIAGVGTVAAWSLAAHAQQTKSQRRIAAFFASHGDDPEVMRQVARFQDELAKLGWLEGQTIHVDYRFGAGNVDYTALAKELAGIHPELIVTQATPLTAAQCSGRLAQFQSDLCASRTRSEQGSLRAWPDRAEISPDYCSTSLAL